MLCSTTPHSRGGQACLPACLLQHVVSPLGALPCLLVLPRLEQAALLPPPLHLHPDVECSDTLLPVTYSKFAGMMEPGDTLYVGRYLVSGADSASLYLEVGCHITLSAHSRLKHSLSMHGCMHSAPAGSTHSKYCCIGTIVRHCKCAESNCLNSAGYAWGMPT